MSVIDRCFSEVVDLGEVFSKRVLLFRIWENIKVSSASSQNVRWSSAGDIRNAPLACVVAGILGMVCLCILRWKLLLTRMLRAEQVCHWSRLFGTWM